MGAGAAAECVQGQDGCGSHWRRRMTAPPAVSSREAGAGGGAAAVQVFQDLFGGEADRGGGGGDRARVRWHVGAYG
ncbi:hypothetical protein [Fodinicola feengrottensis]|uniref:hypothetical protein n=1 Tax=Fodinicola feengrottensis TaxID=435914 RepID=UPI0013D882FE|nr:hypothetical protein [Fodinicola feengrottensis]